MVKKNKFFKNYFTYSLKYVFDFSFFIIISFISFIISSAEVILTYFSWKTDLSTYQIFQTTSPNVINLCLIFIISFFTILFVGFIFRFFTNMLLFNSTKRLQRYFSIFLTIIYTTICFHSLYKFGSTKFEFNISSKTLNFIVIIFFIYSTFYYLIKNKFFRISQTTKTIIITAVISIIVLLDWIIVHYYQKKIINTISKNEYTFIFYNSPSTLNLKNSTQVVHVNWQQLSELINTRDNALINNIGDPNASLYLENLKNIRNTCKNNLESVKKYNLLKYTLPLTNFIPNRITMQYLPELFCLNLGKNFPEIFLYSIYSTVMKKEHNSYIISTVNLNNYKDSQDEIIQQIESILNTFPEIKEHMHFYTIQ